MTDIVDLIQATVRLEQPLASGRSTVGTGFIVRDARPDGSLRTVLVTAHHVFAQMPHDQAQIGFRAWDQAGGWRHAPASVRIRGTNGDPLWTRHPTQDIAAIELPPSSSASALPAEQLGSERVLETIGIRPGDEMMVLGYPNGVAANPEGFPILRAGRVASYPLSPAERYPTYLVDFNVFAGNSGGPVYAVAGAGSRSAGAPGTITVTGLLTQQMEVRGERLAIGNVTQADFITETLTLLRGEPAPLAPVNGSAPTPQMEPVAIAPGPSSLGRLKEAASTFADDFVILIRRTWIVVREAVLGWVTPDPRRSS